ncbi:MAG: hypothetical protein V4631_10580 [Pseudomonadota bacterium]
MNCTDPARGQFDFWLGEWDVHRPDGSLAGINRIEKKHGGCVLHERYETPAGYSGESLNIYDAARKRWHQTWVDNDGLLLLLEGSLVDGCMVLEGAGHRIAWTPMPDGSVQQFWETIDADGAWAVAFDGRYTRRRDQP